MTKSSIAPWTVEDALDLYKVDRWGQGYFGIDAEGQLVANLSKTTAPVPILNVIKDVQQQGFKAPLLVRLPDVLRQRVERINGAFELARQQFQYQGEYRCFYPTKVNQHREVIEAVVQAGRPFGGGVESGSKAELLALLMTTDNSTPVLCNGFKDRSMVEMAVRAKQMGRDITIVIEKPGEVDLLIDCFRKVGSIPRLGVRVKLASQSGGRWNASAGAKSKFGLTTYQLTELVQRLKELNWIQHLRLLHFHPGSQISDVRKIKASLVEAARIYCDLSSNGVPLDTLDVGGGLAIDYTGECNRHPSSKNYTLQEYANDVVYYIQQVCVETGTREPHIVSESGRAITAHHSLLVIPVLQQHGSIDDSAACDTEIVNSTPILIQLHEILDSIDVQNLSESFHDAQTAIEAVWQMFSHGSLTLEQRSCGERLAESVYGRVTNLLNELDFVPSELEELRHQLAQTYVANFSLFQAMPDSWALDQVFPVMPLHRLNERPTRRGVVADITCDSDGQINCFVGGGSGTMSLPLHELNDETYYLGVFLIGAYQEALSDDHNLLGDFHVASIDSEGSIQLRPGACMGDVLAQVHHGRSDLIKAIDDRIERADQEKRIDSKECESIRAFFLGLLDSYSYLSQESSLEPAAPDWEHESAHASRLSIHRRTRDKITNNNGI